MPMVVHEAEIQQVMSLTRGFVGEVGLDALKTRKDKTANHTLVPGVFVHGVDLLFLSWSVEISSSSSAFLLTVLFPFRSAPL